MSEKQILLERVTAFYSDSRGFNGLPLRRLGSPRASDLDVALRELIAEDKISVVFGDIHPNPHIKAFPPESHADQLRKLEDLGLEHACAYPSEAHLASVLDTEALRDEPFTRRHAIGEPQLKFYAFDLSVLETYRNDPRYWYSVDDISGTISARDSHLGSGALSERDQVVLQTFGFAYDAEMNRAVAVFLPYLANLSPEHQQIWNAKRLDGDFKLHPDYWRNSMGEWTDGMSVFTAFLEEMSQINVLSTLTGRPALFKRDYGSEERPPEFGFLLRPTLQEFHDFVHLLDKMISENMDRDFFARDVPLTQEVKAKDGSVRIVDKGSLRLLDEWLERRVRLQDPGQGQAMLDAFTRVRTIRRRPAHAIDENVFDQKYLHEQRDLMVSVYTGIRTLRLILQLHPKAKEYEPPLWLDKGDIWVY